MEIKRKTPVEQPILSITIEQEDKGAIAAKKVTIRPDRDQFQDFITIKATVAGNAMPNYLRLNWSNSIELRDALTLLIEQQR